MSICIICILSCVEGSASDAGGIDFIQHIIHMAHTTHVPNSHSSSSSSSVGHWQTTTTTTPTDLSASLTRAAQVSYFLYATKSRGMTAGSTAYELDALCFACSILARWRVCMKFQHIFKMPSNWSVALHSGSVMCLFFSLRLNAYIPYVLLYIILNAPNRIIYVGIFHHIIWHSRH